MEYKQQPLLTINFSVISSVIFLKPNQYFVNFSEDFSMNDEHEEENFVHSHIRIKKPETMFALNWNILALMVYKYSFFFNQES